ncbi:hypothetical protein [Planomonospora parontospora]|uniref:hypothetical protein n=1 Tax=Planomonospora parontospora TaxID=58119 RepID=UPI0016705F23|nr:hypothetical protein [Planomonospora parontospora]GGL29865.1 hypothetical protein GCM10014719_34080 [Planomonospora parontospora subsp. antibiotica]GII17770.1 hypothetical protein Ppa05_44960 [Planomonospora parontospora subsp. antibiotica]
MTSTLARTPSSPTPPPRPPRIPQHPLTRPAALLGLVSALYGTAQLAIVSPRMGIGWDEAIYASQFAAHAPPAEFSAPRAQGVPLLVAPVTALTDSVTALRLYLTAVSSLALYGAFLIWTRVRPGYTAPLAALLFAGCWLSLFYGNEAMPNLYVALTAVAATGLLCLPRRSRASLAGLAAAMAAMALLRPSDALVVAAPLAAAALLTRPRRPAALAAVATGLAVGWGEWLLEAELRYGGAAARMHAAGRANLTGLTVSVAEHASALDGPSLCRWGTDCGDVSPLALTWWLAIPLMAAVGLWTAWRDRRRPGPLLLAAAVAAVSAAPYLFYVGYAAPRFLMPVYALLALPVAAGALALVRRSRPPLRLLAAAFTAAGLLAHLVLQGAYAHRMSAIAYEGRERVRLATEELRRMGVRAPCTVYGQSGVQIGYLLGCRSRGLVRGFPRTPPAPVRRALDAGDRLLLVHRGTAPPRYAAGWRAVRLPGGWRARFSPAWDD